LFFTHIKNKKHKGIKNKRALHETGVVENKKHRVQRFLSKEKENANIRNKIKHD